MIGAGLLLLLVAILLSACGAAPVAQHWPGLTIEGDTIYAISGLPQQVYILDAETGNEKQTFTPRVEARGIVYWSPVAVGDELAYVGYAESGGDNLALYAFDPETGDDKWSVPADDLILPSPTYADGTVYFADSGGYAYAVDAETGNVKGGWPFEARDAIWAPILVAGDRAYVASMDHYLYCLDAESGELIWEYEVGGAMAAQPTLEDGILYVGAFDGKAYAINADSGEPVEGFEFQAENWIWSEVLAANGRLWISSLDGKLYALDPASGQVLDLYDSGPVDSGQDVIRGAPVQAGDLIAIATEAGRVIAVDESAERQWGPKELESGIYTTPVVHDGRVYVILVDGQIVAFDMADGGQDRLFVPPASE
jgi:outer membrane protein assembly factor BamB